MYRPQAHLVIAVIFFIFTFEIRSQEKSIYTNSYIDPFILNPACAGLEYYPQVHLSIEKQWLNFPGSPVTLQLTGNSKLGNFDFYDTRGMVNKGPLKLRERVGLGAIIFKDNNGLLSTTGGILSYAYHIPLKQKNNLSFGISVILNNYSLNSALLDPDIEYDNFLFTGNDDVFGVNFASGAFYRNEHYFTGISITNILPGISNVSDKKVMQQSYFLLAGYQLGKNNNRFNYEPSIEIKYISPDDIFVDLHAKVYYNNLNWGAISISSSKKVNVQFAIRVYKKLYTGYNYGFTFTKMNRFNGDFHQISLGINLGLFNVEGIRKTI